METKIIEINASDPKEAIRVISKIINAAYGNQEGGHSEKSPIMEGWRPYRLEEVSLDWVGKALYHDHGDGIEISHLITEVFKDSTSAGLKIGDMKGYFDPCDEEALQNITWAHGVPFGVRIEEPEPEGEAKE